MIPKPDPKNYRIEIRQERFIPENPLEFSPREEWGLADVEIERTDKFVRLKFIRLDGIFQQVKYLIDENKYLSADNMAGDSGEYERLSTDPKRQKEWMTDSLASIAWYHYHLKSGGDIPTEIKKDLDNLRDYLYMSDKP